VKNKIVKYLLKILSKHKTAKDELVIRFVDDDYKFRYYGFKQKPPPERYKAILRHHDLLTVGMDDKAYLRSVKAVISLLKNGIEDIENKKKNKDLVKVFAILFELEARGGEPSYGAILEILATTLIRSDEDPKVIDARIHAEKKEYIHNLLKTNPDRVQKLPEYSIFYDSGLGGEMIKELQKRSDMSQEHINAMINY